MKTTTWAYVARTTMIGVAVCGLLLALLLLFSGCSAPELAPIDAGFCPTLDAGVEAANRPDNSHIACGAFDYIATMQPRNGEPGVDAEYCTGRTCPWESICPVPCADVDAVEDCLVRLTVANDCRNFDLVVAECAREACGG